MVARRPADHHRPVNTIAATGPLDATGRLVHADDPAAQLALALARVEAVLADHGRSATDLHALRVLTTDRAAAEPVLDVLTDRLADLGADPAVTVDDVPALAVPGMVVAIEADVAPRLLVVVAHPDDEAFGCGSVLAHATRRGLRSTVVCATRGELGEPAPGPASPPPTCPTSGSASCGRRAPCSARSRSTCSATSTPASTATRLPGHWPPPAPTSCAGGWPRSSTTSAPTWSSPSTRATVTATTPRCATPRARRTTGAGTAPVPSTCSAWVARR